MSKCFARQGIKIPIRKESRFKRPTDRFYGANALYSMNAGPSNKGISEPIQIDKNIASPDDREEGMPSSEVAHRKQEKKGDEEGSGQQSTSQKEQEVADMPTPYKRLSISSYLTPQHD